VTTLVYIQTVILAVASTHIAYSAPRFIHNLSIRQSYGWHFEMDGCL
jgi:hypothetical protein